MTMCECYNVDHPGADPYCEAHGTYAVAQREALLERIAELEAEVAELKAVKTPEKVKRVYGKLNPMNEEDRLTHILHSEGLEAAVATAKKLKKLYLEASLKTRVKFHTRTYPYRFDYIESAYSARHILRTKFLESVDRVA